MRPIRYGGRAGCYCFCGLPTASPQYCCRNQADKHRRGPDTTTAT